MKTMVIILMHGDDGFVDRGEQGVNNYLFNHYRRTANEISNYSGGSTESICGILSFTLKTFDKRDFLKTLLDIEWDFPEKVQILIKDEDEDAFQIYKLSDIEEYLMKGLTVGGLIEYLNKTVQQKSLNINLRVKFYDPSDDTLHFTSERDKVFSIGDLINAIQRTIDSSNASENSYCCDKNNRQLELTSVDKSMVEL